MIPNIYTHKQINVIDESRDSLLLFLKVYLMESLACVG